MHISLHHRIHRHFLVTNDKQFVRAYLISPHNMRKEDDDVIHFDRDLLSNTILSQISIHAPEIVSNMMSHIFLLFIEGMIELKCFEGEELDSTRLTTEFTHEFVDRIGTRRDAIIVQRVQKSLVWKGSLTSVDEYLHHRFPKHSTSNALRDLSKCMSEIARLISGMINSSVSISNTKDLSGLKSAIFSDKNMESLFRDVIDDFIPISLQYSPYAKLTDYLYFEPVPYNDKLSDIYSSILRHFDHIKELMTMRLVSKKWNNIIVRNSSIWKCLSINTLIGHKMFHLIDSRSSIEQVINRSNNNNSPFDWYSFYISKIHNFVNEVSIFNVYYPNTVHKLKASIYPRFKYTEGNEGYTIATTRKGGAPDLPPGESWSKDDLFIVQINFSDFANTFIHGGLLPTIGLLLLFAPSNPEQLIVKTKAIYYNGDMKNLIVSSVSQQDRQLLLVQYLDRVEQRVSSGSYNNSNKVTNTQTDCMFCEYPVSPVVDQYKDPVVIWQSTDSKDIKRTFFMSKEDLSSQNFDSVYCMIENPIPQQGYR
jgi:hypothetical protein